jgi:hypothetical protein
MIKPSQVRRSGSTGAWPKWRLDTSCCPGRSVAGGFRAELKAFPNGKYDDQVDSFSQFA